MGDSNSEVGEDFNRNGVELELLSFCNYSATPFHAIRQERQKGRVPITDEIGPLEKSHFFYVKHSRRMSESEF